MKLEIEQGIYISLAMGFPRLESGLPECQQISRLNLDCLYFNLLLSPALQQPFLTLETTWLPNLFWLQRWTQGAEWYPRYHCHLLWQREGM